MKDKCYFAYSSIEVIEYLTSNQVSLADLLKQLEQHRDLINTDINAFDSVVQRAENSSVGPLHGLPITVKDQIAVSGLPRNFGLDKISKHKCIYTASSIQKLIDAGATIIGKTSMPPYALDLQTFNKRIGRTNNPWNVELTAGGSSGGGASAVASGMSFLDIGADLSGSIRLPAAYCGVCSLLPSEGAIDTDGLMLNGNQLTHFARLGPIARSVADLELAWSILSASQTDNSSLSDFKLGVWDLKNQELQPEAPISKVFTNVFMMLKKVGIQFEYTPLETLFSDEVFQSFGEIMGYETGAFIPVPIRFIMRFTEKKIIQQSPRFLKHVYSGYKRKKEVYASAIEKRKILQTQFDAETSKFDAILLPVCRLQPFEHKIPTSEWNGIRDYAQPFRIDDAEIGYLDALTAFTVPISLMGNPVVTIPIGLDTNGIPVGAQLVGKRGGEWELLAIAKSLEAILPNLKSPFLFSTNENNKFQN